MTVQKAFHLLGILLFFPMTVSAATLSLYATPTSVGVGDTVRVDVLLDSATAVNAFSGALSYSETLRPVSVSDGNSIINLWITRPALPASRDFIPFAGITPGGFSGNAGVLFSVLFQVRAAGTANVSLADVAILRNDGVGGGELVTTKPLALAVGPTSFGGYAEPDDRTPPEPFTAQFGDEPELFGGKNYVVFATVDKDSGIDHYLTAESRLPSSLLFLSPLSWEVAESPYVIGDQHLTSAVYLKAVDRAGNERVSVYPPYRLFTVYEKSVLLSILVAVVLLRVFWGRWGRRFRKNP